MRKSQKRPESRRLLRAGLATAATAAVVLGATATPAYAAVALALSSTSGALAGGNTITGTTTTNVFGAFPAPVTYFVQAAACPAALAAGVLAPATPVVAPGTAGVVKAPTTKRISNVKVAITVPNLTVAGSFRVCVYGAASGTSALLANSVYTVSAGATVTSISPTSGPTRGGGVLTVYGTNFPLTTSGITATLGGLPLTVTAGTATQFTALIPAHAPGVGLPLVVTTASGTVNVTGAFDYINGISATPSTAPSSVGSVDLDVFGTNFLGYDFTGALSDAHVYLVNGLYDPTAGTTDQKDNGPIAECSNVLTVSDTELICSLVLSNRIAPTGTALYTGGTDLAANYTVSAGRALTGFTGTISAVSGTSATLTITTGAGDFTAADVGSSIVGTTLVGGVIPAGTYISAVSSATVATISGLTAPTVGTVNAMTVGNRTLGTAINTTVDSNYISGTPVQFSSADVGKAIVLATKIAPGSVITSVDADGKGATLSKAAILTSTGTPTIAAGTPVPDGAYTLTVVSDGLPDAQDPLVDATFSRSIVASGATFTVAPF